MSDRSPAGPLVREHRVIERIIPVLVSQLGSIESEGRVDPDVVAHATDFMRTYADRCHHGKEEDILFRRLIHKPLDARTGELMGRLIDDHALARAHTRRLIEANGRYAAGDVRSLDTIASALRGLANLYPPHIELEDRTFFKRAMEYFGPDERADMSAEFEAFDRALVHDYYREVVEDLEHAVSLEPGPAVAPAHATLSA